MDRKAFLAILLSTILIIVYQILFVKPPEKPLETAGTAVDEPFRDGTAGDGRAGATATDGYVPDGGVPPEDPGELLPAAIPAGLDEGIESRTIRISTPLYELQIDTRGGMIRSVRLPLFGGPDGGPVALVSEDDPGALGLILNTGEGNLDLRGVVFHADQDEIRVDRPDGEASLLLERSLPNGIRVSRTFSFSGDSYIFDMDQKIGRAPAAPEVFSYRLLLESGIAFTEGNLDLEKREMAAVTALAEKVVRDKAGKVKAEEPKQRTGGVRWAAVVNKYFALAILPVNEADSDVRIHRIGDEERVYLDIKMPFRDAMRNETRFGLYAGPLDMDILKNEAAGLEGMIDLGWTWIQPISRITLKAMNFLHRYVPNYGLVIILISLITKILFYRLTHKSFKSMKDMQKIQGLVGALREKHKGDPQRLNKETMALYKKEGVNPMGGCLPMLLQMPVFIALYQVLQRTIALRQAPFFAWIDDLSQPDILAGLPFNLPFMGDNLSLLPLLMGASMFFQQKMTTVDPKQKAMIYMMPIMFTVLFYRLPSGLVLYWLVNNVFSIGQQYLVHRDDSGDGKTEDENDKKDDTNRNRKRSGGRRRKDTPPAKEST